MSFIVKITKIEHLTHDVLKIQFEKPEGYLFRPGQAADISLNKTDWYKKKNCFTFTSLLSDPYLEFVIKTYPSHQGFTNELLTAKVGDELILYKPFGDIQYKGEGVFIAGGAGITPFLSILKELQAENKVGNNKLLFANKTKSDIILEDYFQTLLGKNFVNILSDENLESYEHGFISADIIKKNTEDQLKYYYLCGPKPMMDAVERHLSTLGVEKDFIVKEGF